MIFANNDKTLRDITAGTGSGPLFAVLYNAGNYLAHPFKSHMDAVYFSMTTSSTIAYGDNYPVTDRPAYFNLTSTSNSGVFRPIFEVLQFPSEGSKYPGTKQG